MKKFIIAIICILCLCFTTTACTSKNEMEHNEIISANELETITENGKYGIAKQNGEKIVEPIYDYIAEYSNNLCAFFIQDLNGNVKIGYFDTNGNIAIEPRIADLKLFSSESYDYNFYNEIALFRDSKTHKYGYIDKSGKFIVEPIYTWAEPFTGILAPVTLGKNYGYIDTTGEVKIPFKFEIASPFSEGMAAVFNGSKWGYINEKGAFIIPYKYGSFEGHDGELIANPFINGYAGVYLGEGQIWRSQIDKNKFALIDKNGNILNGQKYDSLRLIYMEPNKPVYIVIRNGIEITMDCNGKEIKE